MQQFEIKFEGQKIPEWYNLYFDYQKIKRVLAEGKKNIKGMPTQLLIIFALGGLSTLLPGFYHVNEFDEVCQLRPDKLAN